MPNVADYIVQNVQIAVSGPTITMVREGWRTILRSDEPPAPQMSLSRLLAGQIPYYYREPRRIGDDFSARHDALSSIVDLAIKAPTTPKFQYSHCGEILASLFVEEVLGWRRLYSKLTLTTAENTNVHKMDGFFVDTTTAPYTYIAVEAKTSIQPTPSTPFRGHRHGILKYMVESLENYGDIDQRFDFTVIRDRLEEDIFSVEERRVIKKDLVPPGPTLLNRLGVATINSSTVRAADDDFILSTTCTTPFQYRALVVTDLSALAEKAYARVARLRDMGE